MKVLVTGGAGFIGSHVVDRLVMEGHDVRVIDSLHPAAHGAKPDYLNDAAEYLWRDLRDAEAVDAAVEDVDAVCHQASMVGLGQDLRDITDYVAHNDTGTAQLIKSLHLSGRRVPIVLASSMVVYGEGNYSCPQHGPQRPAPRPVSSLEQRCFEPCCTYCGQELRPEPVREEAATDPRNVYAATKLHQEHLMQAFGRETGSPLVCLRYHNVYGDRMPADTPYAGVASIFRSALQRGRAAEVFEDGGQLRDFVHVSDVARANAVALSPDAPPGTYNVSSGRPHSVLDMARQLSDVFKSASPPRVTGAFRLGDVRHVFASAEKARSQLGFEAKVSFEEGFADFARAPLRKSAGSSSSSL